MMRDSRSSAQTQSFRMILTYSLKYCLIDSLNGCRLLGLSWRHLGGLRGFLGRSWRVWESTWAHPGAPWGVRSPTQALASSQSKALRGSLPAPLRPHGHCSLAQRAGLSADGLAPPLFGGHKLQDESCRPPGSFRRSDHPECHPVSCTCASVSSECRRVSHLLSEEHRGICVLRP